MKEAKVVSKPKGWKQKAIVRSAEGCDYVVYARSKPKRKRSRK